jgi:hypothetical protein
VIEVTTNQPCCAIYSGRADPHVQARHTETATIILEATMTRRTIEQRLTQLEAQKKTLQARLGKQDRARDTRRKVLLGALVLQRLQPDQPDASAAWLRTWLATELPVFLTRDMDKILLADLMSAPKLASMAATPTEAIAGPAAQKPVLEPA